MTTGKFKPLKTAAPKGGSLSEARGKTSEGLRSQRSISARLATFYFELSSTLHALSCSLLSEQSVPA
jgi:hypothetical protein